MKNTCLNLIALLITALALTPDSHALRVPSSADEASPYYRGVSFDEEESFRFQDEPIENERSFASEEESEEPKEVEPEGVQHWNYQPESTN